MKTGLRIRFSDGGMEKFDDMSTQDGRFTYLVLDLPDSFDPVVVNSEAGALHRYEKWAGWTLRVMCKRRDDKELRLLRDSLRQAVADLDWLDDK